MSAGIEAATAGACRALPAPVALPPGAKVLDLGGGTGSWSIALAAADPTLTATIVELPDVASVAVQRVSNSGYADRIAVRPGDLLADDLPTGHDTVLLANVVHYFAPETNQKLLQRVRNVARPGDRLLIADFWTDPTHTQPLPAALMAGEFAIHLTDGDVYSVDEVSAWLAATGWQCSTHTPLAGPISLVGAEASSDGTQRS